MNRLTLNAKKPSPLVQIGLFVMGSIAAIALFFGVTTITTFLNKGGEIGIGEAILQLGLYFLIACIIAIFTWKKSSIFSFSLIVSSAAVISFIPLFI